MVFVFSLGISAAIFFDEERQMICIINYPPTCLVNPPEFADFNSGDYRLATGSPCIDAGMNESWMTHVLDLDGRPRLDRFSELVDMECYEHIASGTLFRMK